MFDRLARIVEAKARAAAEAMQGNVESAFAAIPGVQLWRESDELVIEAMGLTRRWLNDVRMRFAFWSGR